MKTDSVDVTRETYEAALPAVEAAIQDSAFLAIDCEMTGLFLDTNSHSFLDDMPARYAKLLASGEAFVINQFGLSAFCPVAGGGYEARTFNFNLFPRPFTSSFRGSVKTIDKVFTCQAGSLEYLAQHNFSFDKVVYHGISFLPLTQQTRLLKEAAEPPAYHKRTPHTDEDRAFVAALVSEVTRWYATDARTLEVARGVTSFQRSLAYSALRGLALADGGWRGFYMEKKGDWRNAVIEVTRATAAEAAEFDAVCAEKRVAAVKEAGGFSNVMSLIRAARKPVIGHNCLFDLVYVLTQFVGPYATWAAFKSSLQLWFPGGIYDTKYLSRLLEGRHPGTLADTSLGPLYQQLGERDEAAPHMRLLASSSPPGQHAAALPDVRHAEGFTRYSDAAGAEFAHEAGFDAYMTGACFASLLPLVAASDAFCDAGAASDASPEEASPSPVRSKRTRRGSATAGRGRAARTSDAPPPPTIAAAEPYMGRVNMQRTDMPYCATHSADPPLPRPDVYVVVADTATPDAGLPSLMAMREAIAGAGLGNVGGVRLELLPPGESYTAMAVAPAPRTPLPMQQLASKLRSSSTIAGLRVMTWQDFADFKAGNGASSSGSEGDLPNASSLARAASIASAAGCRTM